MSLIQLIDNDAAVRCLLLAERCYDKFVVNGDEAPGAAPVPPRRWERRYTRKPPLRPMDRRRILKRVQAGMRYQSIADELKFCVGTISKVATMAGIRRRPRYNQEAAA